ncbi:MAG: YrzE family protein [Actinobacteria bacterium]|nr:YrzE family protein [Actinomycetota bacterium]MBW3643732.1 YrzE family protein [Actinomycetota bacterium]
MRTKAVETGRDRKRFARAAGMGQVSLISVLAGTLVAFASFAILLAIVAGVLSAVGIDTEGLTSNDYRELGIGAAVVAGLVLFLSYFFGGYIAGRLARRAGALNGGLVLVVALLIGAVVALVVGTQGDTEALASDLRVIGVPTSGEDYASVATIAGILALVAMLAGSVLGGLTGERWHGKLTSRAFSPDVGPEATARQEVEAQQGADLAQAPAQQAAGPTLTERLAADRRAATSGLGSEGGANARSAPPADINSTSTAPVATAEGRRRERPLRSDTPRRQQ